MSEKNIREEKRTEDIQNTKRTEEHNAKFDNPKQYILMEYTYDSRDLMVTRGGPDSEIRGALCSAGIDFDSESVESFCDDWCDEQIASGRNAVCMAMGQRYDLNELKERIDEHALNFRILSLKETEKPVRVYTVTYRMKLPEGMDVSKAEFCPQPEKLRKSVCGLETDGEWINITMGPLFMDPRMVYRYIFDIPSNDNLHQIPERTGFTYENRGILDLASGRKMRDEFIKYRKTKISGMSREDREYDEMEAYISSSAPVNALKRLMERDYSFLPPPYHCRIPKNLSGRKRDIYAFKGNDKYLLKLLAFSIRGFDNIYADGLYSFRTTLTAKDFLLKIRNNKEIADYYIVKTDVSDYVHSIVPEIIIPQLKEIWKDDPSFVDFLSFLLLRRECIENGVVTAHEPGGLGGVPLANLFMNVYLMDADRYFYPRAPLYCRYSDDIIIFARDKEEAEEYLGYLYSVFERKKLHTNAEKTKLIEPGGEVEILGCRMKDGKMDISDHAKGKLRRKIRMHARLLLKLKKSKGWTDEECGRKMCTYCNRLFFGRTADNELSWARWMFPVISETTSLSELDHYIQDAVRYAMCGSLSKKRYRISYDKLKSLGYKSLLHAYYHFSYT